MQAAPGEIVRSINPANGEPIAEYTLLAGSGIDAALEQAQAGFRRWRALPLQRRAIVLHQIAARLRSEKDSLARLITLEMGKVLGEAEAEVEKSAWACEFVAEHGEQWLADQLVSTTAARSYVSYQPLGPVLAILPWNFPVWQVFRCAASALMAGNTIVLKHAPNVLGCAAFITKIIAEADPPGGLLVNCPVAVDAVAGIIADRRIAAVTLTGSPGAGRKVAALAGAACKKSVLELGGSDAFIVLADADLDAAVQAAIRARYTNCGQVCLAAKRFLLEAPIAGDFTRAIRCRGVRAARGRSPRSRHAARTDGAGGSAQRTAASGVAVGAGRSARAHGRRCACRKRLVPRAHRAGGCHEVDAGVRPGDFRSGRRDVHRRRMPMTPSRPRTIRPSVSARCCGRETRTAPRCWRVSSKSEVSS